MRTDDPRYRKMAREQAERRAEAATEGINQLILALDSLNKAIVAYEVADRTINLVVRQVRDDLDEEITALLKERRKDG